MERNFREMLKKRQEKTDSLVCVGLDPLPEKLPESVRGTTEAERVAVWMKEIVKTTAEYTSLYKPQKAHWEAFVGGDEALRDVVSFIKEEYPDIPVFLDCKRGDIGRTQERYKVAHFEIDGVDGMNFSPYMGKDCMEYLADENYKGRAIVSLCYTSNSSAREVQDIKMADGKHYWEFIAETVLKWAEDLGVVENAGLVMAAAFENPKGSGKIFSEHLSRGREIVGDKLWFLIPGIGTQGGFIAETVKAAHTGYGSIAINSSSGITFSSQGEDYAEAAGEKAKELRDAIREAMPK